MSVLRVPCRGRLAAIAESLRHMGPITLLEIFRCDHASFLELEAVLMPGLDNGGDGRFTILAETVIEVAG